MASSDKINPYNLADLKNTSDDTIPNYLNSLGFRQSHFLVDVRLALGYSSIVVAAACGLWDYKFGFEDTKLYTALAVAVYTLLDCALMLWLARVERGIVYQGVAPSGEKISIATTTKKNDPTYRVSITIRRATGSPTVIKVDKPFAQWFDQTGRLVARPFQEMLAAAVPLIAKLDPARASHKLLDEDPALLDAVLAAAQPAGASDTPANVRGRKAEKRRKA